MNNPVQSSVMTSGGKREGAGRKEQYGESTEFVAFRIPKTLHAKLQAYADKQNLTKSQAIVRLLQSKL